MNLQEVKARLEENNFTVQIFETKEEAADYLDRAIDGKSVGMGGSMSLAELKTFERLSTHNEVFSHQTGNADEQRRKAAAQHPAGPDQQRAITARAPTGSATPWWYIINV